MRFLLLLVTLWASVALANENVIFEYSACESEDCPSKREISDFLSIPSTNKMVSIATSELKVNGQPIKVKQLVFIDINDAAQTKWMNLKGDHEYYLFESSGFVVLREDEECDEEDTENCLSRYFLISGTNLKPRLITKTQNWLEVRRSLNSEEFFAVESSEKAIKVMKMGFDQMNIISEFTHELRDEVSGDDVSFFNESFQYVLPTGSREKDKGLVVVDYATGTEKLLTQESLDFGYYRTVSDKFVILVYLKKTKMYYSVFDLQTEKESKHVFLKSIELVEAPNDNYVYMSAEFQTSNFLLVNGSYDDGLDVKNDLFDLTKMAPVKSFDNDFNMKFDLENDRFCEFDRNDGGEILKITCKKFSTQKLEFNFIPPREAAVSFYSNYILVESGCYSSKDCDVKVFHTRDDQSEVLSLKVPGLKMKRLEDDKLYLYAKEGSFGAEKTTLKSYDLRSAGGAGR